MESNYEVWLRDRRTGNRRSIILWASSFSEAEQLALNGSYTKQWFDIRHEEIFKIDKEYDPEPLLSHDEIAKMNWLISIEP